MGLLENLTQGPRTSAPLTREDHRAICLSEGMSEKAADMAWLATANDPGNAEDVRGAAQIVVKLFPGGDITAKLENIPLLLDEMERRQRAHDHKVVRNRLDEKRRICGMSTTPMTHDEFATLYREMVPDVSDSTINVAYGAVVGVCGATMDEADVVRGTLRESIAHIPSIHLAGFNFDNPKHDTPTVRKEMDHANFVAQVKAAMSPTGDPNA